MDGRPKTKTKGENWIDKICQKILKELLSQVKPVDFREKAGLSDDAKIGRQEYIVITIEEIVETATANDWGLCAQNGFINVCFWGKIPRL